MTDITLLGMLQTDAINLLLEETFRHLNRTMREQYVALGRTNARILHSPELRFCDRGIIYPPLHEGETLPYGTRLPLLHYSLLNDLDKINQTLLQADYHYVRNFFVAVIGQAHNALVLDALLPTVLVNALREHFNPADFKIIDMGVCGALQQEPISETKRNIATIKNHYSSTIATIQHLLMDKLLLQG